MRDLGRALLVVALAVGAVVTIGWLANGAALASAREHLLELTVAFAFTVLGTTGNIGLRWLRWHNLCRRLDARLRARDSLRLFVASLPMVLTPFYVGELLRGLVLSKRYPGTWRAIVQTWVVERGNDAFVMGALALAARGKLSAAIACLGAAALLTLVVVRAEVGRWRPGAPVRVLGLSVVAWALPALGLWFTLHALGVPADWRAPTYAFASGSLVGAVSGIPLGAGLTGSWTIVALRESGVPLELAPLAVAVHRLATAWFAAGVGAAGLVVWRRQLAGLWQGDGGNHFDAISASYQNELPEHIKRRLLDRKIEINVTLVGKPGAVGLDVGCGHAWYASEMAVRGYRISGIDGSGGQITCAQATAQARGLALDLRVGSALELPFPDASFDFAYAINVLHHVGGPREQMRAFEEIVRVLRPGGVFILQEINTENPVFHVYMGYVFPFLRDIDEGNEVWIRPTRLPAVPGATWDPRVHYFTFLPDFVPAAMLAALAPFEAWLERGPLAPWSAHYAAVLRKG